MSELVDQEQKLVDQQEEKEHPEEEQQEKRRERPVPHPSEGYLLKLKHSPSTMSSWNKRYFKVDPQNETLSYFNTEKDAYSCNSTPRKVFKLSHISKVFIFHCHSRI